MSLLVKKNPQDDFFIADIFDNTNFKDDLASMEHPIFSLSIKPDRRILEYRNRNKEVRVVPSIEGLPTIFDKDFLLYCGSLLVANYNQGREKDPNYLPPRTIRVSAHDYFKATQRSNNGKAYGLFEKTLLRLRGCTITTTIQTNGKKQLKGFGLIENYEVIESSKVKNRMVALEIRLSDWYYSSIIGFEMLTINKDYFRLRKPLERRLYEIARKHCGNQKNFTIRLENLFAKSGSSGTLRLFKSRLKTSINDNHIPDYQYELSSNDLVTITRKKLNETPSLLPVMNSDDIVQNLISRLKKTTLINAEKLHNNSYTDWDMKDIILQFVKYIEKSGEPKSLDGAFMGFVKKKIKTLKKDHY